MAEAKRRLPVWMLKPHKETKSRDSDPDPQLAENFEDQNEIKPSKPKQRRKVSKLDVEDNGEPEVILQKCPRNRNNRGKRKTEDKIGKGVVKRNKRKMKKSDEIDEFSPKFSDDEIDLTVDDLVSIAQEYVNAEKENQRNQTSTSANTEENTFKKGSKSAQASSSSNFETTEKNIYEDENIKTNISKTSDAAQDMLDLFLGPLLKKSSLDNLPSYVPVEKNEPTCSTGLFDTSDRYVYKGEEIINDEPLEKKKSSLKGYSLVDG